jgi:hypothetical protein
MQCQAHPNPPLELIELWQSYLAKSEEICTHRQWNYPYEKSWQGRAHHADGTVDFNEPPLPVDEEEFVQTWEETLENATLYHDCEDIGWTLYGSPS